MQYMISKWGGKHSYLYPKDLQKRAVCDRLMNFDLGSVYKTVTEFTVSKQSFKSTDRKMTQKTEISYNSSSFNNSTPSYFKENPLILIRKLP